MVLNNLKTLWLPVCCVSGLCPDWDQWDQTKPVDNAREAMQQADDWLGIPQVPGPLGSPPEPSQRQQTAALSV